MSDDGKRAYESWASTVRPAPTAWDLLFPFEQEGWESAHLDEPGDDLPETKRPCLLCMGKPSARWRCPDCAGEGLVSGEQHARQKLRLPANATIEEA